MDQNIKYKYKVSVLMPVYNASPYLEEAIQSIINQTFSDWELIITDDGSTDNSIEIIKSISDSRIKFLQNPENKGIIYTRNRMIEESSGEYLAIFDGDDVAHPEKLQIQVDFLDKNLDYGFCGSWGIMIDPNGRRIKNLNLANGYEEIKCNLLFSNTFIQSSMMIRRDILSDKYRYDDEFVVTGDFEFWTRLAKITKTDNLQKHLVKYRWHPTNISHSKKERVHTLLRKTYKRELMLIGINATEEELDLHSLSVRSDISIQSKKFDALKKWFRKIANAAISKSFDRETMNAVVCFRWLFICKERKAYSHMLSFPVKLNMKSSKILFNMIRRRI